MSARERLEAALAEAGCRREGAGAWTCPAHEDRRASLSVSVGRDGRALVTCHAGCELGAVLGALGLAASDLFDEPARRNGAGVEARYVYTDGAGAPLYEVRRLAGKQFRQARYDPAHLDADERGYVSGPGCMESVRRVLYRLELVQAAAAAGELVYVVEGEKDAEAAERTGAVATCNPAGAGKWHADYAEALQGARVVVVADRDERGRAHARDVARSLAGVAASVATVEAAAGKDVSDHLAAGLGLDELAPVGAPEPVGAPADAPAPPDEPGGPLLDALAAFIRRYVSMTAHQAIAVVLWLAHAHAIDAAESTPYLAVTSPEKRSGKSRLIEVCTLLVPGPLASANVSVAALFRVVAEGGVTVLLDEADAIFGGRRGELREGAEDLRGLLNAGHRRGAEVVRMVGQGAGMKPQRFAVFAPKLIAGIGELPDTVADRAIPVRMRRAAPGERVERFRRRRVEPEAASLRARVAGWCGRRLDALAEADPALPDALDDRAMDGWEPLFAIADAAGGGWPERARAAALALSAGRDGAEGDSLGSRLLADVRQVLDAAGAERMASAELAGTLNALDESPWGAFRDGKGIDARIIARMLRAYDVRPRKVRVGEETIQGYRREDLADAWARYLAPPEGARGDDAGPARGSPAPLERAANGTSGTTRMDSGVSGNPRPEHDPPCSGRGNGENPHGYGVVPDVPDGDAVGGAQADSGAPGGWCGTCERPYIQPGPGAPRCRCGDGEGEGDALDWRDLIPGDFNGERPFAEGRS